MSFVCTDCGGQAPRWQGRCSHCGAWSTLEAREPKESRGPPGRGVPVRPLPLSSIEAESAQRRTTGVSEIDRVLGGGAVPGSVVLIGGEPGIGKSTLLLAMGAACGGETLYVAGEEAPQQIALRARRLGIADAAGLALLDSTDTRAIAMLLADESPELCVVDSVQTMRTPGVDGAPGGPAQVRAAADVLVPAARASGCCLVLVGQVTKVGGIAGPRTLEHAVDTVLYFEGDRHLSVRALRAVKNRFGPTDEIGLFEMREDGLKEVRSASDLLLQNRAGAGPGAVVAIVVEGRRPLCLEVQALVVGDQRSSPRRRAQGVDPRRAELIVGVAEALFVGGLASRDVFVNVVGGLDVQDTGLDLGVAAAVLGAQWGSAVPPDTVVFGEVGLRGEVRPVAQPLARLKEARAMGFERAFVPRGTPKLDGLQTVEIDRVDEVLQAGAEPDLL
ncbi:MAG: DNA repair protein RadA [Planctomycetota bacterium]|jgi:DNA repair protein RadA/Sms